MHKYSLTINILLTLFCNAAFPMQIDSQNLINSIAYGCEHAPTLKAAECLIFVADRLPSSSTSLTTTDSQAYEKFKQLNLMPLLDLLSKENEEYLSEKVPALEHESILKFKDTSRLMVLKRKLAPHNKSVIYRKGENKLSAFGTNTSEELKQQINKNSQHNNVIILEISTREIEREISLRTNTEIKHTQDKENSIESLVITLPLFLFLLHALFSSSGTV